MKLEITYCGVCTKCGWFKGTEPHACGAVDVTPYPLETDLYLDKIELTDSSLGEL